VFACYRVAEALLAQERHDYQRKLRDMELAQLEDLMRGPALSVQSGNHSDGGRSRTHSESDGIADQGGRSDSKVPSTSTEARGGASFSSFSTITQVSGEFARHRTMGLARYCRRDQQSCCTAIWHHCSV
jgi:hypothetical protein